MIYLDSNESYIIFILPVFYFTSLEKDKCVYENRHILKSQESLVCDGSHATSEERIKALALIYHGKPQSSHTVTD